MIDWFWYFLGCAVSPFAVHLTLLLYNHFGIIEYKVILKFKLR